MGLFDVMKAKKKLDSLLTKPVANEILKRVEKTEKYYYTALDVVTKLDNNSTVTQKYKTLMDNIEEIIGDKGILYLLSTKPHTTSKSNFIPLVKKQVVGKPDLIKYFKGENPEYDGLEPINNSLMRYLRLEKKDGHNVYYQSQEQLSRNKNKNLYDKMRSIRISNRLKVVVVALLICLINYSKEYFRDLAHEKSRREFDDRIERQRKGLFTLEEYNNITKSESNIFLCTTLTIPEGVEKIEHIFPAHFPCIKSVKIPNSVKEIQDHAFVGCKYLEEVSLGSGVETIGEYAFSRCGLKSINMPEGLKIIEDCAFQYCSQLATVSLNQGLKKLGHHAFHHCNSLKSIDIPGTIEKVSAYAFASCKKLTEVKLQKGITRIGACAFSSCPLKSVVIPSTVKSIDINAFELCTSLEEVELQGGLEEGIDVCAFAGCPLKRISIPNSINLSYVSKYAFIDCPNEDIIIEGSADPDLKDKFRKLYRESSGHADNSLKGNSKASKPTTNYYGTFIKKFKELKAKGKPSEEDLTSLKAIYADHTADFNEELNEITTQERSELARMLIKFYIKLRTHGFEESLLEETIGYLRNQIVGI